MSVKKKTAWLILAASLLQFFCGQALAADIQENIPPEADEPWLSSETADGEAPVPEAEEVFPVLDEEELSALVGAYLEEHGMTEENSSVSFCYTGTGETWSFNGDKLIVGASLYKLPLMMNVAKLVAAGELQQDGQLMGLDISYIERRSLTFSNNEVSERVIEYFFPYETYRIKLAEIAGYSEEELPEEYFWDNVFSANFMMRVLQELYNNTENYPNILECLLDANPGQYFRLSLDGKYTVAQKYGAVNGYCHTAGIIYTPVPCLVTVMTYHVPSAENAIAELGELLADYAVTLDQRTQEHYAELERQAEEQRRLEEEARLAAEAAEQERLRLEEEARLQAEEEARRRVAEAAEAEEQARLEAEQLKAQRTLKIIGISTAGIFTAAAGAYIVPHVLRKRREEADGGFWDETEESTDDPRHKKVKTSGKS